MRRREFFGAALAGVVAANLKADAQGEAGRKTEVPKYTPKIEHLYKSPDRYPNALEAAPDGLWVGDQVSERVLKLDWKTGKVLADFVAEAHNTSGLAVGGGYLWIGCNGGGTAKAHRPFNRPFDREIGEVVQCDMNTGKQVKGYPTPWGSTHGTVYDQKTNTLWVINPVQQLAVQMDPKDDLRILKMVSISDGTAHGVEIYDGALWVLYAAGRSLKKHDIETGRVLEEWPISTNDPDPHGLCIHEGYAYYCDAGLGGGRTPSKGTIPQLICRFSLEKT